MDFNKTKKTYKSIIEDSIAFTGKDHSFFNDLKIRYISDIVNLELATLIKPKLLDVGCGHGYIHSKLSKNGFDVVGIDVASEVLQIAKKMNPTVPYFPFDGHSIPFKKNTFDIVTLVCVMHHISPSKWSKFLIEIRRVLTPGGLIIVIEHNPFNPLTRYLVSKNEIDNDAVLISSFNLKRLLKKAKFRNVDTKNVLFTPFASWIFRMLDKFLFWCPLGGQYCVYGKA
jgi:SAM-dependent methyltransferase